MSISEKFKAVTAEFKLLSLYQRFEHVVILILTALVAIIIVAAVWNLTIKLVIGRIFSGSFDPSNYTAFQAVFGMIFTVIIALEFKKTLLVAAERQHSVVQIQTVVVIALLAICRKIIILDLAETNGWYILSLAAAILALGVVYWLIRDRDHPARVSD
jgi:uncharacterized membrane protein (DUF373 family)